MRYGRYRPTSASPRCRTRQIPSLAYFVQQIIAHPPFGLYQSFMRDLVLPNGILFGYSVLLAELATGISLLLGLFTAPRRAPRHAPGRST